MMGKGLSRLERVGNGSDFAYVKFSGSQVSFTVKSNIVTKVLLENRAVIG